MEQAQPERRSLPRYAVDTEATVVLVNEGPSFRGRIVELSLDGCRLQAERFCGVAAPASIELTFKLNGMGFRLGGTLQWADARQAAGIEFSPMAERRRDVLLEVLSELDAKRAKTAGEEEPAIEPQNVPERNAAGNYRDVPVMAAKEVNLPAPPPAKGPTEAPGPVLASGSPSRRERRQQSRHAVDSRATIYFVDVRAEIAGRIIDVSLSGCRIRSDERFPVGIYRRVETEFMLDGLPFRLGGVVQSMHDKFTVGIRFLDMSERKREQLVELMEEMDRSRDGGTRD